MLQTQEIGQDPSDPVLPDMHVSNDDFCLESLRNNTEVLATSSDWLTLAYLEPLMAKKHNARINGGEKAMRTLNLF